MKKNSDCVLSNKFRLFTLLNPKKKLISVKISGLSLHCCYKSYPRKTQTAANMDCCNFGSENDMSLLQISVSEFQLGYKIKLVHKLDKLMAKLRSVVFKRRMFTESVKRC